MIESFLVAEVFTFFLLFCRIGSAVMVLPGFGELYVPIRVRLAFAVITSVALTPLLGEFIPPPPGSPLSVFILIVTEIIIGILMGAVVRILISATHILGMIVAFQASLAASVAFDPSQGTQATAIGNLFSLAALVLIFALDLHHIMLRGVFDSYTLFTPGDSPPMGDFADLASQLLSKTFNIAVQISSPLILVAVILYLGAGVLARLMPSMQVFFVLIPLQLTLSFVVMYVTFNGMMLWYINYFEETLGGFIAP